jgi:hypothetical protein
MAEVGNTTLGGSKDVSRAAAANGLAVLAAAGALGTGVMTMSNFDGARNRNKLRFTTFHAPGRLGTSKWLMRTTENGVPPYMAICFLRTLSRNDVTMGIIAQPAHISTMSSSCTGAWKKAPQQQHTPEQSR